MTIASEITRINNNIAATYTALSAKGATLPVTQNSANLATTAESVPQKVNAPFSFIPDGHMYFEGNYVAVQNNSNAIINFNYQPYITPAQWQKELIIQLHIKTPSTLSNQWIMSNGTNWNGGIGFTINSSLNGAFWCCVGQSDTTQAVTFEGSTVPQTDTDYWIRIYKPNTENEAHNTLFQISTDGVTWTTEDSVAIANIINDYTTDGHIRLFNLGGAGDAENFKGRIYFDDTFISVDGEKIWQILGVA